MTKGSVQLTDPGSTHLPATATPKCWPMPSHTLQPLVCIAVPRLLLSMTIQEP